MAIGLAGSAVYSGLETGIYTLNRVRLQIRHNENKTAARILQRLVHQPIALLSTLLIGNNLTNYMGTASLAVILQHSGLDSWQVVFVNIIVITPLLLIFGEVLPKDLFSAHSDQLTYPFARFLDLSRRLFWWCGLLPLTATFNKLLSRLLGIDHMRTPFHPRRQVELLVKESVGYGLLSDEQSAIFGRVLELGSRTVADEMIPWDQVATVRDDHDPSIMWDLAHRTSHARFPAVDASGAVQGIISVYDALVHDKGACPPLRQLMMPAVTLDATTPLRTALTTLQTKHKALAVVTNQDKPVGVVTIKDLVESITGELTSW